MIGKWHLGVSKWEYTPTYRGFDTFYGGYGGGQHHYKHGYNAETPACKFKGHYDIHLEVGPKCGEDCSETPDVRDEYSNDVLADYTLDLLDKHDPSTPGFFVFSPFTVHDP